MNPVPQRLEFGTAPHHFLEVVLSFDFFRQVGVFPFQPGGEAGNLLVREHVVEGQRYLAANSPKEVGVLAG